MTATAYHSKRLNKYRMPLSTENRVNILGHLKHDRAALAGNLPDYCPSLGNRAAELNRQCARTVIRLVLN